MKHLRKKGLCISLSCLMMLSACFAAEQTAGDVHAESEKELRGVWVASVFGIDYPSKATTDDRILRNEATVILDNIADMGFNAVFLQVRPCSDALYKSGIFPWSQYLTGTQGLAPNGGFDPLAYFVEEAHKRGLQLHAWLNPYRVTAVAEDNSKLSRENPASKFPELTVLHTDEKIYYNPGEPAARKLIIDGIAEILENYDVDGIHLDDYFYPGGEFADEATYQKYGGGFGNLADWRRNNNTMLIKDIQAKVRELKPEAVFGVSPFGIWANKGSHSLGSDTRGNESYTRQFADTRLWVKEGYLDYIMPQLYWQIGFEIADYQKLLPWWIDVASGTGVKLYIGLGAYRAVDAAASSEWYGGAEIRRQVSMNRQKAEVSGYCMFTYNSFIKNAALLNLIKELNHAGVGGHTGVFPDIGNIPQRESIEYVASLGIIKGYDDGKFHPHANIRRGDFVLMLTRMFSLPIEKGLPNFADVASDMYYYDEIATAKAKGLILGLDGVHFAPDANITNQDLYVMAYRALAQIGRVEGEADESVLGRFADGSQIADYAREAIAHFTEAEVFKKSTIDPQKIADRANAAEFIANVVRSQI